MSLDALRESLPAYARDVAQSLAALDVENLLTDQQKWGCYLACAYALGVPAVMTAVEAAAQLTPEARNAAKAAAALMAMNNIYFRALHLMQNAEYRTLPSRLRGNASFNPGVDKTDYELWCLAVSAINGCGACLDSHEEELKRREVAPNVIQAALRIAAVTNAVSRVLAAEAALT
jgi:alkyl hydroperoxide reductase subunit D